MKNKCISPIVLKNGTVVSCGHCEICRSNARLEWQYRLRIHLMNCDFMPMFITLTYDNKHLPMINSEGDLKRGFNSDSGYSPTLLRSDVSKFIKAYKRKYGLNNTNFTFFGCGEYGDLFNRPHYHLLFFSDGELYQSFQSDTRKGQARINSLWTFGNCHLGISGYDGMAYCTKYVLKSNPDDYLGKSNPPFTIVSKGLGMNFLNTQRCKIIKKTLDYLKIHQDVIYSQMPVIDFGSKSSIQKAIDFLQKFVPDFTVVLDDGTKVFLPRAIRKKIVGTFEYFKDNPLWLWNYLNLLNDSIEYYEQCGDYDSLHENSFAWEQSYQRILKINQNKAINNYNKQLKRNMYETV